MRLWRTILNAGLTIAMAGCAEPLTDEQRQIRAFSLSCAKTLAARDPASDARAAHMAGDRRLLSWRGGGGTGLYAPGVITCRPFIAHTRPSSLPALPLGHSKQTDYGSRDDLLRQPCWDANLSYGIAYNHEMFRIAPGAFANSCRPPDPPPPKEPGPARPREKLALLFHPEDYPVPAIRAKETGTTKVALSIAANGRVDTCRVLRSSGSESLDKTTCRLLKSRARFYPARNVSGEAIGSEMIHSQPWRLETLYPSKPRNPVAQAMDEHNRQSIEGLTSLPR